MNKVQSEQKICPQKRQWCFRRKAVNGLKQFRQSATKASFIQYFFGIPPFFNGLSDNLRGFRFLRRFFSDIELTMDVVDDATPAKLVLRMDLAPPKIADEKLDEILRVIGGAKLFKV